MYAQTTGPFGCVNVCICLDSSLDLLRETEVLQNEENYYLDRFLITADQSLSTLKVTLSMNTSIMQHNT